MACLLAAAAGLLAFAPAALGQVSFTGPTNFPAGETPFSVAVGDFNGDGDPDLAVANLSSDNVSVQLGGPGGSFVGPTNFAAGDGPSSVAVGDFNADGDLDLAVANIFSDNVSVLLGGPGGTFTPPTSFAAGDGPSSVSVGDFNADGDPDLAVANIFSANVSVLLGGPGGTFTSPTNFAAGDGPSSVAVGEFNGDGDPDLAVANFDSDNVSVLLGGPGGGFTGPTSFPTAEGPRSVTVGDFNGDGDLDLALATRDTDLVSVLLGGPGGTFGAPTNFPAGDAFPGSIAVGDFNGDGDLDLAVGNWSPRGTDPDFNFPGSVSVLVGGPGGTFAAPISFPAGNGPASVSVGDFNGDGRPDLAVGNSASDNVSVLLNQAEICNNGEDDDNDGLVDGNDPDCPYAEAFETKVLQRSAVSVGLRCPSRTACSGALTLMGSLPVRRSVKLGTRRYRIGGGRKKVLRVKLTRKRVKQIKRARHVRVRVVVRPRAGSARPRIATPRFVLNARR